MGFLAPWWLLLGAAAAVPLLLHLLRRRIGARVEFPAVRYLERAEREHSRRLKLRNLLLMLVRVLALLLVALAAARPVARVVGAGHPPTALAIVLDNSMSTGAIVDGRPALDGLRTAAGALLRQVAPGDRVWLVTADGEARGGSAGVLLEALDRIEPLAGAGSMPEALGRAAALVRAAGLSHAEVAVLTDAQASSWPRGIALADVEVSVLAPALQPPANRAVVGAEARPARWSPAGAVEARLRAPGAGAAYRVALVGEGGTPVTVARGSADSGSTTVTARVTPDVRGWTSGFVELEPDELRADDRRWFAVWIGAAPAVSLSPGAGPFARAAVDALVASGRARRGAGVSLVPADEAASLPAVLLAPASPVRIGAANRTLERLGVPWRFGALRRGEANAVGDSAGPALGADVAVTQRYALEARPGSVADTLARVSGEPWIVAGPGYAIIASPLDPGATSFPLRASFVPWLADVLAQRLGADAGIATSAAPGDSVRVPAGATALELPDGERVPVAGASLSAPDAPGVYFWRREARRTGALVVNPEAEESVLDRLSAEELRGRIVGRSARAFDDEGQWRASLLDASGERPLATPLLVLALLLLAAESLLTRGTRRAAAA